MTTTLQSKRTSADTFTCRLMEAYTPAVFSQVVECA